MCRILITGFTVALLLLSMLGSVTAETTEERFDREYLDSVLGKREHNVLASREAVASPEVAIAIAVAVWSPIYGEKALSTQRPFVARRLGAYWLVSGTLPTGFRGGTADAVIRAQNGEVLYVSHGR